MDPGTVIAAQATIGIFRESMLFAMNSSVVGICLLENFSALGARGGAKRTGKVLRLFRSF